MKDEPDFQQQMARIEELIQRLESVPDTDVQNAARVLMQLVLGLHAKALSVMLKRIGESTQSGQHLIDSLAKDELVSHLLMLHGLHPLDAETRVRKALDKTTASLQSQGVQAELLEITAEGVVRLQVDGELRGGFSAGLIEEIESAVFQQAPDVVAVDILGLKREDDLRLPLPLLNQPVR